MNDGGPTRPVRGTAQARAAGAAGRASRLGGPLKIAVVGVGLIGGSIGLAARERLGAHVRGCDPDADALARAGEMGAIDEPCAEIAAATRETDYVFVATPVGATVEAVRSVLAVVGPQCVVSDVGSTKRHVARAVSDERFIPGHPLAGAETAGVQSAREGLFDGAVWYLTPGASGRDSLSTAALARIDALLSGLGARPVVLSPEDHDRLMASVSHLPHVLANVLVSQALRAAPIMDAHWAGGHPLPRAADALGTNPSFRDATRVAGANTAIWTDIYLANGDLLVEAIDEAIRELSGVRDALDAEDAQALAAWNERAREQRERLAGAPEDAVLPRRPSRDPGETPVS